MKNLFTISNIDVVCILYIIFHMRPKESIYKIPLISMVSKISRFYLEIKWQGEYCYS